jgi:hypothetical protein
MRTTLSLDDDIFQDIRSYADSRSLPLGKAVSELVRRGLSAATPTRIVNGLQVFDLPRDSPRVSTKKIRELEGALE